ncbi:DUF2283 domain-containing protein [Candidatus Aerophobetes bacterium]|nr:DUF2283 domain-containing protein [Candidatus Aerophobetes bacterium]
MIQISYDEEAGAIYLKLSNKEIARTIEIEGNSVLLDFDKEDKVVGLEILDLNLVAKHLGPILQRYNIDKERIKKELIALKNLEPVFA